MTARNGDGGGDEAANRHAAGRTLTPQARRAVEEAETRRAALKAMAKTAKPQRKEIGGRDGPEPIRYGDWEVKGRTSDF